MKVRFIVKNNLGSSLMRGAQIAKALSLKGIDAKAVSSAKDLEDCILFFVKFIDPEEVIKAAEKNLCVYDPVDIWCGNNNISLVKAFPAFGAVLFPTMLQLGYFGHCFSKGIPLAYIPHHFAPEVQQGCQEFAGYPYTFRLGYIGADFNHKFSVELADVVPIYHPNQWNQWAAFFTCHYSVREPNTPESLFKPATKVFTAAACNANIITTRDADTVMHLGDDYPYYVDKYEPEAIFNVIKKASEGFELEEWYEGLGRMKAIREKTNLDVVSAQYESFIRELAGEEETRETA